MKVRKIKITDPITSALQDTKILQNLRGAASTWKSTSRNKTNLGKVSVKVDWFTLRCDGYILSPSKKIIIIIELNVPMEENIEDWHNEKLNKYLKITSTEWKLHYLVFEVGCRGFIPPRFMSIMRQIGFSSSETRPLHSHLQLVARKSSYIIWINRYNKDFHPFRFTKVVQAQPLPSDAPVTLKGSLSLCELSRAEQNRVAALSKLQDITDARL